MMDAPEVRLVFLTDPEQGVALLNIQVGEGELQRLRINRDQLFRLNHETADILQRQYK